jgi:hypothetical protein
MLINLSNHPSSLWSEAQTKAATEKYGQIINLPFPDIDPNAKTHEIDLQVEVFHVRILKLLASENTGNQAVHIMGELTFCFALVARLQKTGITCLASTTNRETINNPDGTKTTQFGFVKFREYGKLQ